VSDDRTFLEISPWIDAPADPRPPLDASTDADVVVVGGGYTGLSTALSLRAEGADVVVLEQDFAGSGASGRNAGHLTPTIGKDLPTLLRLFGRERAAALVQFADAAVDHTTEVLRKHEIDCDYVESGNLMAGLHAGHEPRLRKAAEAARALGADVRFLSSDALRERGVPPAFTSAVLEERGGGLHPGRYVQGLRSAALRAGVRLHEGTRVLELRDGAKVEALTEEGRVAAPAAVIATNAYTASLGRRRRHVVPVRVSLFETEPLDAATAEALDWRGREGVYTAHEILESYRPTAQGTITGGS
jgi:glycine/D-amino acid oxidase-like deaminating enzyme